jgi:hypothetical protein
MHSRELPLVGALLSVFLSLGACSSAPEASPSGASAVVPRDARSDGDAATTAALACAPGFHDCDGTCADDTNIATCGTSCVPCLVGPEAEPRCDGKTCGMTCLPPYADCDRDPKNGCEADLLTDPANCGRCHGTCSFGTCAQGECVAAPLAVK